MVEEMENFQLDSYFDAISQSVDQSIDEIMTKLQPQLSQYLKSRNVNNVNESDLREGCRQLIEKIKHRFAKNIAKFQLYSIRNVFTPTSDATTNTTTPNTSSMDIVMSSSSSSSSTNNNNPPQEIDAEEQELDRTLLRLRNNYMKLRKDYLQVSTECRDMDTLLKEMRSAMFNLRVALQNFEDFEISPVSETTYLVNQYQVKLQECILNGQDLLQRMKHYEESQQTTSITEEETESIKMDTTENLQQLAKGFQG